MKRMILLVLGVAAPVLAAGPSGAPATPAPPDRYVSPAVPSAAEVSSGKYAVLPSALAAKEAAAKQGDDDLISTELLRIRDPFKRPIAPIEKQESKTPLEMYASERYKMIGVITGMDRLRAIILDPDGKTHFVSEGMKIGMRKGVITKIQQESIRVREKLMNVLGKEEPVDVDIRLPGENGSTPGSELSESRMVQDEPGLGRSVTPSPTPGGGYR
jgi:hypothetical protein